MMNHVMWMIGWLRDVDHVVKQNIEAMTVLKIADCRCDDDTVLAEFPILHRSCLQQLIHIPVPESKEIHFKYSF